MMAAAVAAEEAVAPRPWANAPATTAPTPCMAIMAASRMRSGPRSRSRRRSSRNRPTRMSPRAFPPPWRRTGTQPGAGHEHRLEAVSPVVQLQLDPERRPIVVRQATAPYRRGVLRRPPGQPIAIARGLGGYGYRPDAGHVNSCSRNVPMRRPPRVTVNMCSSATHSHAAAHVARSFCTLSGIAKVMGT
jgi:hypothetical protein